MTKDILALSSFPRLLLEALIIIATFPVGHQPQQKLAISSTSINILCSEPPNMALRCLQLCDFRASSLFIPQSYKFRLFFYSGLCPSGIFRTSMARGFPSSMLMQFSTEPTCAAKDVQDSGSTGEISLNMGYTKIECFIGLSSCFPF